MNTFIKNYQLLNEDARCNLYCQLTNIAGYDNIAANGYRTLLLNLIKEKVVKIELDEFSIDHILPIAAAANYFDIYLHVKVPSTLSLNIAQLYQLWGAIRLGAEIRQTMENALKVTQKDMQAALTQMTEHFFAATLQQCQDKNLKAIVFPFDTSIFERNDYFFAARDYLIDKKIDIIPVTQADMTQYDYLSWVQSIDLELNYGTFWFEISRDGKMCAECAQKYFSKYNIDIITQFKFDNYLQLKDQLFAEITARFTQQRTFPKNIVKVANIERFEAFKTFCTMSHTIACGSYITPIAALLSQKITFDKTDNVLAMITGSLLTTSDKTTFDQYLSMYLQRALQENYEIVSFSIAYDARVMSNTIQIMQIINDLHLNIQHWKQSTTGVDVVVYSPGYAALIQIYHKITRLFGEKAFYCEDMPEYCPPIASIPKIDYNSEQTAVEPFLYQTNVKSFEDIGPESIEKAAARLRGINAADMTGVLHDKFFSTELKTNVFLVMENIQQTGSFKIRGASNMLIKAYEQAKAAGRTIEGVVACSAGNHAQGVAKTACLLGIKCTIVVPSEAPMTKLLATMRYRAEVIKYGEIFDVSNGFAMELAKKRNWMFIPPYNAFDVIEGQGTIASEFYKQMADNQQQIDEILVNVGGGGLISGISLYAKKTNPDVKIVGVQADRVFPLKQFKETGKVVPVDMGAGTIADGCNVKIPGGIHNEVLQNYVDQYIGVSENDVAATVVNVLLRTKTICEGAGVMGLAAMLYGKYTTSPDKNVGIVICGGNIDIARLQGIYNLGLIAMGKLVKIKLVLPSKPKQLTQIVEIINRYGGNLIYVKHARNEGEVQWDQAWVNMHVMMPCMAATKALKAELAQKYEANKIEFPAQKMIPYDQQ